MTDAATMLNSGVEALNISTAPGASEGSITISPTPTTTSRMSRLRKRCWLKKPKCHRPKCKFGLKRFRKAKREPGTPHLDDIYAMEPVEPAGDLPLQLETLKEDAEAAEPIELDLTTPKSAPVQESEPPQPGGRFIKIYKGQTFQQKTFNFRISQFEDGDVTHVGSWPGYTSPAFYKVRKSPGLEEDEEGQRSPETPLEQSTPRQYKVVIDNGDASSGDDEEASNEESSHLKKE